MCIYLTLSESLEDFSFSSADLTIKIFLEIGEVNSSSMEVVQEAVVLFMEESRT